MRYSPEHKEDTRRRVVQAAGAIAKKQGFGTTGVDGLMGAAGLKGSTFYHHFATKNDLLEEIIGAELEGMRKQFAGKRNGSKRHLLKQVLAYMSVQHVEEPELGCVLPTLSAEVARADENVKKAYEDAVKGIYKDTQEVVGDGNVTWALLALSVGAVMMARAMASEKARDEVLKACGNFAKRTVAALEDDES
ncbi:TetR/AcrR family transcriptional regulator [Pseudomonas chlororaphis]|uniref:TetR/AcrR family transcriptional regulator n=1 Tax=Pseudomonas chlororaphis TaxID=587753 RepID=UPI001B307025|nr:TetR/AcrR family transcriptional regulator [Pseudomonas chlororaphis]MBP5057092.1 TetR/AcrR family transcriptional regulator [Pseudomonas chlororaphis]MBP5142307.1 TetR/AcrR family transcriptional regulator [Pseudomonas chlororaphis]QTT98341.1 TetR/AcrR family transcriptional regulator [Pseudomonas chlororaphis]